MVPDACKRRQRLDRNRIEELGRISDPQGERPADLEMECSVLLPRDLPVHVLDLGLEHHTIDQRARVRLR